MARVFLSYRRAEGKYAVGWIAERLSRLEEVTDVRSAFRDGDLRVGDDFPSALSEEILASDILVAIIGPKWLGPRRGSSDRIHDPADWVGRELVTALNAGKRVLPVLIDGAEPLSAADLPPHLLALADIHSITFNDESDLDSLANHLRSHLDEIDRERARLAGLEQPIVLERSQLSVIAILLTALAAVLGGIGGWLITTTMGGSGPDVAAFQNHDSLWKVSAAGEIALWSAMGVAGHFYSWRKFSGYVKVQWRPVITTFAFAVVLLAWTIVAFGTPPPLAFGAGRSWLLAVLALVLLAPWILALSSAAWTTEVAPRHELGSRARTIGELNRIGRVSVAVLSVAVVPGVISTAGLDEALEAAGLGDFYEGAQLIAFGTFLTLLVVAAYTWSRAQLRNDSTDLSHDLADIVPEHRKHAEAHLVTNTFELRPWWMMASLSLPLLAGIFAAAWI